MHFEWTAGTPEELALAVVADGEAALDRDRQPIFVALQPIRRSSIR